MVTKISARVFSLATLTIILLSSIFPLAIAITNEDAEAAGAGFHEPGPDWWDSSYKYRIPVNTSSNVDMDVTVATTTVDFSDYFNGTPGGVIDLASMQLVKELENETFETVAFQVETDAVDIWNPATLLEVEENIVGPIIAENGTFVGTVFNAIEGSGYVNQSIWVETFLDTPADEVIMQIVVQPEEFHGIGQSDYLQLTAGIEGNWGTPTRLKLSDMENETGWTDYLVLPLETNLSGNVWIRIEAPGIYGNSTRYFALDFGFLDGDGYNRTVEHHLPTLPNPVISQESYYPRFQSLQHRGLPECNVSFITDATPGNDSQYYLYFNFVTLMRYDNIIHQWMVESENTESTSNHALVYNDAVPIVGPLKKPQPYFMIDAGNNVSFFIDKDDNETEGVVSIGKSIENTWGYIFEHWINFTDGGFDLYNYFGTVYSTATVKNDTMTVTFTLYKDHYFLDVTVESSSSSIKSSGWMNLTAPSALTHFGNETTTFPVNDTFVGTGNRVSFMDAINDTYLLVLCNDTLSYSINNGTGEYDINMTVDSPVTYSMHYTSSSNKTSHSNALRDSFINRLDHDVNVTAGNETGVLADPELFVLNARTGIFDYHLVGDVLEIALFGHNLQSITVEITGVTNETGSNGSYTIPTLSRSLFSRKHPVIFRGRNEFGDIVETTIEIVIADNIIDVVWAFLIGNILTPLFVGVLGTVTSIVIIAGRGKKSRKSSLGKNCIKGTGDNCIIK
jgi:hypothetical protein